MPDTLKQKSKTEFSLNSEGKRTLAKTTRINRLSAVMVHGGIGDNILTRVQDSANAPFFENHNQSTWFDSEEDTLTGEQLSNPMVFCPDQHALNFFSHEYFVRPINTGSLDYSVQLVVGDSPGVARRDLNNGESISNRNIPKLEGLSRFNAGTRLHIHLHFHKESSHWQSSLIDVSSPVYEFDEETLNHPPAFMRLKALSEEGEKNWVHNPSLHMKTVTNLNEFYRACCAFEEQGYNSVIINRVDSCYTPGFETTQFLVMTINDQNMHLLETDAMGE